MIQQIGVNITDRDAENGAIQIQNSGTMMIIAAQWLTMVRIARMMTMKSMFYGMKFVIGMIGLHPSVWMP